MKNSVEITHEEWTRLYNVYLSVQLELEKLCKISNIVNNVQWTEPDKDVRRYSKEFFEILDELGERFHDK